MSKPSLNFAIFDFDLTITKKHTFVESQLQADSLNITSNHKKQGKRDGSKIAKSNLPLELMDLSGDNLFAIATYHNNPDYIAGMLEHILNKQITPTNQIIYSQYPQVAIKVYQVAGQSKPLLLSYIPKVADEFGMPIWKLDGKNNQIRFLHSVALEKSLIDDNVKIDFFDDTAKNIACTQNLTELDISSYQVTYDPSFTLKNRASDLVDVKQRFVQGAIIDEHSTIDVKNNDISSWFTFIFDYQIAATSVLTALISLVIATSCGASIVTGAGIGVIGGSLAASAITFFAQDQEEEKLGQIDNDGLSCIL